ncbi:MAG TPA: TonB family protein [Croceibacterium sp.]|nr:TonB family protein [Croceibacterium sp.]
MTAQLLDDRKRAYGLAGAIAIHVLAIALVSLLAPPLPAPPRAAPGLVAIALDEPPPPTAAPPPDRADAGEAAPPSRGPTEAPSPPKPPAPLARPTPAEPAIDPGSRQASGAGAAPGSGAGQGGEGSGTGSGDGGLGRGSGVVTPPVRVAGALTNADYRRTRPPEGAAGTVFVSYRVRSDGAVDRCTVLRTSGYEVLDRATCRLIEQRFRYTPARDTRGQPIDWEVRTDYTWRPR